MGNPFQSNFSTNNNFSSKQYLTILPRFDPMPKEYSAGVFQNWHKIHFILHFHVCYFSNNRHE